jgi:hypothetical protein
MRSTALLEQAAIEDLVLAVVEDTSTESLTLDIVYDLQEEHYYDEVFLQMDQGAIMSPSFVPDKARFTDLIKRTHTIRGDNRHGCSINVKITGDVEGEYLKECESFKLLEASYQAPIHNIPLVTPLLDVQNTFDIEANARFPALDESRISFHLDTDVHGKAMGMVLSDGNSSRSNSEDDYGEEDDI